MTESPVISNEDLHRGLPTDRLARLAQTVEAGADPMSEPQPDEP